MGFLADICKFFRRYTQKHFFLFFIFCVHQRELSAFISENFSFYNIGIYKII